MTSSPHALLSRDAIEYNFNHLKRISYGAKVMCAVKGNAYGHGITEIVNSLENTDGFVVARLSEARLLRKMKVKLPITLLGGFIDVGELAQAIDLQCDAFLCEDSHLSERHYAPKQPHTEKLCLFWLLLLVFDVLL